MIFEHEIPKGSRLYFGKTAKAKRVLENSVCEILEKNGFEEILTPNFSYSQHQSIEDNKKLIKFSDEENEQVSLRADSTLDVVRIIQKDWEELQIIENGSISNQFFLIHQKRIIKLVVNG